MTVPAKKPVTVIRKGVNPAESLKAAASTVAFVSGQEITPDPADPSIPLLIRSANLHPVDVRQQPKMQSCNFLSLKSTS